MKELLSTQYELVKSSRHALFAYCATMDDEDLYKQIPEFNNNSIRDMLVHNINTYISWIDNFGLDRSRTFYKNADINSLDEIKQLFEQADLIVNDFLTIYSDNYLKSQTIHLQEINPQRFLIISKDVSFLIFVIIFLISRMIY